MDNDDPVLDDIVLIVLLILLHVFMKEIWFILF